MHLSVYFPGLVERAAATPLRSMPSLARLIDPVDAHVSTDGAVAHLAATYRVDKQQDWPLAPLRAASLGHDPGGDYWLRATPVLLEAGHDDVRVRGGLTDLQDAQAHAILAMLSQHFASDGLVFIAGTASDWLVRTARAPALTTRALRTVVGDRVRPHLPSGADASQWHRWTQEIEMLLHDHPVNIAREQDGRSIVNSVWWQHGGVAPPRASVSVATWGEDDDLSALAQHVGVPAQALPKDVAALWQAAPAKDAVISIDPAMTLDELEVRIATPVLRALDQGVVQAVDVVVDGSGTPALRSRVLRRGWWPRVLGARAAPLSDVLTRVQQVLREHRS